MKKTILATCILASSIASADNSSIKMDEGYNILICSMMTIPVAIIKVNEQNFDLFTPLQLKSATLSNKETNVKFSTDPISSTLHYANISRLPFKTIPKTITEDILSVDCNRLMPKPETF